MGKKVVGEEKFANGKNILNPVHNPNAADDIAKIDKTITKNIDDAITDNIDDVKGTTPKVDPIEPNSPFKNPDDYNWVDEFGVPCNPLSAKSASVVKTLSPWDYLVAFVSPIGVHAAANPGAGCFAVPKFTSENTTYHPRIRERALQDPKAHNFPQSFDDQILTAKPIIQSDGSYLYELKGYLNETGGVYQIALNPQTKVIFHRTFISK